MANQILAAPKHQGATFATWLKRPTAIVVLAAALAIIIGGLVIPPTYVLFLTSFSKFTALGESSLTLGNFNELLSNGNLFALLRNTFTYALASSLLATAIGGLLAWIVERTDTPLKGFTYVVMFLTFAIPTLIQVIAWILLLGPNAGALNAAIKALSGGALGGFNVESMTGMVLVQGLVWSPLMFFLILIPFRSTDSTLEEAALVNGGTQWQVFWRISLPLAMPGIIAALLLSFVRSIESFDVPTVIGLPAGIRTLSTEVYLAAQGSLIPDYGQSAAYGVLMLFIVGTLLVFYGRQTARAQNFAVVTGKGLKASKIRLGSWRWVTTTFVLVIGFLLVVPVLIIFWASFLPAYGVPKWDLLRTLSLKNYHSVLVTPHLVDALANTLLVSAVAATVAAVVTFLVAWVIVRSKLRWRHGLDHLVSVGLVFPGVVAAVAVLRTYVTTPLYGSIWILVIVYLLCFMPFAMRFMHVGLVQIHQELEESARMSGATAFVAITRITLPLAMPAVFGAWALIFLTCAREFAMAQLLSGPNNRVVSVSIYGLWNESGIPLVAALSVIVSAGVIGIAYASFRFSRRYGIAQQ